MTLSFEHKLTTRRITLVVSCLFVMFLGACSDVETSMDKLPIQDPALITGELENGVHYAVLRNQTPPETGALRVRFATGSLNEVPGTGGLAHYVEHMAFNGSKNVPEGEMIKMLERYGLAFGSDTNAHTSTDETVYKLNLPNVDNDILDVAFMLMRETAENLTMDQGAIERELGIILSEKRTRDTAAYRSWEAQMNFLTEGSDLMSRLPIGTDASLNSIKSEDFLSYYKAHYHPQKTLVTFVGDVDTDLIIARIKETFGDWNPENAPAVDSHSTLDVIIPSRIAFYAEEGLLTDIRFYALRPYEDRTDTLANRRERLIRSIATGLMRTRMQDISERPDPPFIFASMGTVSSFDLVEGVQFLTRAHKGEWERAVSGVDQELRRALEHGYTSSELDVYVKRLTSSYEAGAKGAATRATTSRTGGLVKSVLNSQANDRVFTHPKDRLAWFNEVKSTVTLSEINNTLRSMWGDIDDISIFMKSDKQIDNPEQEIRDVLQASRKIQVLPLDVSGANEFLYTEFGTPGSVVSDIYVEDVDAYLVKFENNVRLNFKQTDFSDDRVFIRVDVGDGSLSIPRKDEGFRRMALNVIKNSGLEAHDSVELRRLLAGKIVSTNFNFSQASDAFTMSTVTVPQDMGAQLDYFTAKISAPAFRADIRDNYIKKMKAWYPTHDTTVTGVANRYVPRLIRNGDARFGFGEGKEFYAPKLSEIEAWLKPELATGLIEITVVGDIDKETVVSEIARTFAALPLRKDTRNPYNEMRGITFPKGNMDPVTIFHRGDETQSQMRVYWPAPDGLDVTQARRLNVLRAIFRNRMVAVIREDEAATYSPRVGAYSSTLFEGYGYLTVILNVVPDTIPSLFSKIDSIAADVQAGHISQDEFDRAITPIQEGLDDTLRKNKYWMNVLRSSQTDGAGIEKYRSRDEDYGAMTLADVKTLAATILQKDRAFRIQILPRLDE